MYQRRQSFLLTLVLCAFVLSLPGCSKLGPSTSSTSTASAPVAELPKPCSLITQAEVESALGKGASMTANTNPRTGIEECSLKPAKAAGMDSLVLVVHQSSPQEWEKVKKTYVEDNSAQKIPGLGDDAINVGLYGVWVHKGNAYIQIYGAINTQRQEKAELFLAERAVSRM
jgi:hypothetical protein